MREGLKRSLAELQKTGKEERRLCPICFEVDVEVRDEGIAGSL